MKFTLFDMARIDRNAFPTVWRRWVSEGRRWMVDWHSMLFGVRVSVGLYSDGTDCLDGYDVSYCCGDDPMELAHVTVILLRALELQPEKILPGDLRRMFPFQHRKPMHNDPETFGALIELARPPNVPTPAMSYLGRRITAADAALLSGRSQG
jgi:hypothetical protein